MLFKEKESIIFFKFVVIIFSIIIFMIITFSIKNLHNPLNISKRQGAYVNYDLTINNKVTSIGEFH